MLRMPVGRGAPRRRQIADGKTVPAPVGGWDAVSPLADMPADRAITLTNFFPQPGYVELRRGHYIHAGNMGSGPVESLMAYNGATPATSKLFACANTSIYDVTTGSPSSADVAGLTNNRWQYINFSTSAGKYLWCCNGYDDPRHYNGSAWAAPSLSVTTFSASDIVHVNAHKQRIWVIFRDSTTAGYLAASSIAGTVTNFPLGSYLTKGGHLVAMATWTIDGGDGVDDKAVFISSEGQCIVFSGDDPSSSTTWGLQGVYNLGPPIGRRCFTQVAGDLALVNVDGVLPLSRALNVDRSAAPQIAITARINSAMNAASRDYKNNFGWEVTPYQAGTMAILNVPLQQGSEQQQYVMNTLTGAWCQFTGQNANCWAVFNNRLYFGGNDGNVCRADVGSIDVDSIITGSGQTAYSYFGSAGQQKLFGMAQPLLTTSSSARPAVGISTDFKDNADLGTPTAAETSDAVYDSAIYDTDVYAVESRSLADWTGLSGYGQCASIHFRASKGSVSSLALWDSGKWDVAQWQASQESDDVTVKLNGFNITYERGNAL